MRFVDWIKVILFGMVAAVALTVLSLMIDKIVRPNRDLLFVDLTYLVYLIVSIIAAVSGAVVAVGVLISRSLKISLIIALIVAITISYGLIRGAFEIYTSETFFDAPMFYADIVQVILNLIIYPIVTVLIWKLFREKLLPRS